MTFRAGDRLVTRGAGVAISLALVEDRLVTRGAGVAIALALVPNGTGLATSDDWIS